MARNGGEGGAWNICHVTADDLAIRENNGPEAGSAKAAQARASPVWSHFTSPEKNFDRARRPQEGAHGRGWVALTERGQETAISRALVWISGAFGRWTCRVPSLNSALTWSVLAPSGRTKERSKVP